MDFTIENLPVRVGKFRKFTFDRHSHGQLTMALPNRLNCLVYKPREYADMKRITSSVGLVALGAASLQASYAPGLSQFETSKPWKVSAAVRGFYDDNYATVPSANAQESFGIEVAPEASVRLVLDQTLIRASYAYSGKYFEDDSHWDHSHRLNASLDHKFSERYSLKLSEQFTISQEPEIFFGNGTTLRNEGDNIHNRAGAEFEGGLTRTVGYRVSYFNDIYSYDDATRADLLDRVQHDFTVAPTWLLQENTILFVGARYSIVDFDSAVFGDRSHDAYYGFVGLDHEFNSQLSGSARFGFYYVDYDNAAAGSSTHPYADFSLTYTYAELSSVRVGFKIDQTQTDVAAALAQSSTGGYFVWSHQLAPKLAAKVTGAITSSEYEFAGVPPVGVDDTDIFGTLSGGLTYMINKNLSADAGYVYTRLDSDVGNRAYTRNRVYLGVTATF
jgi:hypothetical protein